MDVFQLGNAFGSPVYHERIVSSTMDEARRLAAAGAPHGTVVVADVQEAGRGRVAGRVWADEAGKSLLCTTLLRFPSLAAMPRGLTLRAGLAAARAVEDAAPALAGRVLVKWPNDLLVVNDLSDAAGSSRARKLCGILCESDGKNVFVGVGINVGQTGFPEKLAAKATSIAMESGAEPNHPDRFTVLVRLLARLKEALSPAEDGRWKAEVEARLFLRGRRVRFMDGAADSGKTVEGVLSGIGDGGELLIKEDGQDGSCAFVAGELLVY